MHAAGPLVLRLALAVVFGHAAYLKLTGENWFAYVQDRFWWPFNLLPADLAWPLVTGLETLGAAALLAGFGTRTAAGILFVLTLFTASVAHAPVDWTAPASTPYLLLAMLATLTLTGPGPYGVGPK